MTSEERRTGRTAIPIAGVEANKTLPVLGSTTTSLDDRIEGRAVARGERVHDEGTARESICEGGVPSPDGAEREDGPPESLRGHHEGVRGFELPLPLPVPLVTG